MGDGFPTELAIIGIHVHYSSHLSLSNTSPSGDEFLKSCKSRLMTEGDYVTKSIYLQGTRHMIIPMELKLGFRLASIIVRYDMWDIFIYGDLAKPGMSLVAGVLID